MSIIKVIIGGRSSNNFDQFSLDVVDANYTVSSITGRPELDKEAAPSANTRIDWKETPQAHVFKADLPGLKKEEVKVVVEDGRVLQISGERGKEEEKNDTWHLMERSGEYLRRLRLPENAKVDQVKASLENTVLTVTVPKEEIKRPQVKSVEISEGSDQATDDSDYDIPKRPSSPFFVFMESFRESYMKEHPNNKFISVVAKAGGDKWRAMTEAEKAPFVAKAERRKADYDNHMMAYNSNTKKAQGKRII